MAEDAGEVGVIFAFQKMQVCVAEAGGGDLDEHFAWPRFGNFDIDDLEISGNLELHRCPHRMLCSSLELNHVAGIVRSLWRQTRRWVAGWV
jgi:hypothetical protein